MKAPLKLEWFGYNEKSSLYQPPKPWVRKLTGYNQYSGKFQGHFLKGQVDFSNSNSSGSRGVFLLFLLDEECVYEVKERVSWKKSVIWYAAVSEEHEVKKIKKEHAELCLS